MPSQATTARSPSSAMYAEAHFNRSNLLIRLKRFDEALVNIDRALALEPEYIESAQQPRQRAQRARAPRRGSRRARSAQLSSMRISPTRTTIPANAHGALGRHRDALVAYGARSRSIPNTPRRNGTTDSRGSAGRAARRLSRYEWRWRQQEAAKSKRATSSSRVGAATSRSRVKPSCCMPSRVWATPFSSRRYVPLLAARGAKVILECDRALAGLLAPLKGATAVIAGGTALPPFDLALSAVKPSRRMQDRSREYPGRHSVSFGHGASGSRLARAFAAKNGLRVGLVWSGNADPPQRPPSVGRIVAAGFAVRRAGGRFRQPAKGRARGGCGSAGERAAHRGAREPVRRLLRYGRRRFAARPGCCGGYLGRASCRRHGQAAVAASFRSARIGAGCSSARTAPGTRPRGCSASPRSATGKAPSRVCARTS